MIEEYSMEQFCKDIDLSEIIENFPNHIQMILSSIENDFKENDETDSRSIVLLILANFKELYKVKKELEALRVAHNIFVSEDDKV